MSQNQNVDRITHMPLELIDDIFKHLDVLQIIGIRRVSTAFKDYVEKYHSEKQIDLYEFSINNDSFETSRSELCGEIRRNWFPKKCYQIIGNTQLNWIRVMDLSYSNSSILGQNRDLAPFLKNLRSCSLEISNKDNFDIICQNISEMTSIQKIIIGKNNLQEDEVLRVLDSLRISSLSRRFQFEIKHDIFLTEKIADAFLQKTKHIKDRFFWFRAGEGAVYREKEWGRGICKFFQPIEDEERDSTRMLMICKYERRRGQEVVRELKKRWLSSTEHYWTNSSEELKCGTKLFRYTFENDD